MRKVQFGPSNEFSYKSSILCVTQEARGERNKQRRTGTNNNTRRANDRQHEHVHRLLTLDSFFRLTFKYELHIEYYAH